MACEPSVETRSKGETAATEAPAVSTPKLDALSASARATPRTTVRIACAGEVCGSGYQVTVDGRPIGSVGAANECPCGRGQLRLLGPGAGLLYSGHVDVKCGEVNEVPNPLGSGSRPAGDAPDGDIMKLLARAAEIAKARESEARLIDANFERVRDGSLDFARGSQADFSYAYQKRDPAKPPGEDELSGTFSVMADGAGIRIWADHTGSTLPDHGTLPPLPACDAAHMWAAVVESGVPRDAVARVVYRLWPDVQFAFGAEWSFRVEGHDEMRRTIDANTCEIRGGPRSSQASSAGRRAQGGVTVTPSVVRIQAP